MTEIRCRELVGAYAVGALEPPEAAVLADHLLTCLRCRHVLAEAEETAAMLAAVPPEMFLDGPADPNDPLLRRTLQAIRLEAAAPQVAGPPAQTAQTQLGIGHPSGPLPLTRPAPRQPAPAAADGGFPGWSGQTARSHRRRAQATTATEQRRRYLLVGAAAAAVLVLGGGVMLGSKLAGEPDRPSSSTQQAASVRTTGPSGAPTSAPSATAAPEAKVFTGSNSTTKVSATINVTPDGDVVHLSGTVTGLQPGQECKLYVTDDVGAQKFVTTWTAKGATASLDAVASIDPARQVAEVELLNAQNEVLVITNA